MQLRKESHEKFQACRDSNSDLCHTGNVKLNLQASLPGFRTWLGHGCGRHSHYFTTLRMPPFYLTEKFTIVRRCITLPSVYSMFKPTGNGEGKHNQCPDHSFHPTSQSIPILPCQTEFQPWLVGSQN